MPRAEINTMLDRIKEGTPPKKVAALDVWQGRLAAHESGCKPMLAVR
uniref:Uncharacterized protein n=1 Tax=Vitis vinifera TaxID=29760 RepID=F6I509_VITVI